jgi:hypothetical protein
MKKIIDVCCGSKMFYFDKNNPNVLFQDIRELHTTLCDGRKLDIQPDVMADFTNMPYPNKSFKMVIFDPPHLFRIGDNSWMAKKYGKLPDNWKEKLFKAFNECWRILDNCGVLIFKWNEQQIKLSTILKICPFKPICGNRAKGSKTVFLIFMKL